MAAIQVNDLRKSYGDLVAVDGVSFAVEAGETFGLLGPNGAGKSTTIGMIVGSLRPDTGTVTVDGEADPTRPAIRRKIGVTPQSLALYAELTAEENLAFFGRLYGLSGDRLKHRVEWALAFAGLTDRRRDRVAAFSGGMQRRLNLVCGLLHEPPVILLDEPSVGVDPQSRNLLFENIEALKREGRTILYTTHYMEEAERPATASPSWTAAGSSRSTRWRNSSAGTAGLPPWRSSSRRPSPVSSRSAACGTGDAGACGPNVRSRPWSARSARAASSTTSGSSARTSRRSSST
ncbi:MAG TPA: ABC transporter ATP-binding protein [Candidatus Eisenbacteria bacterium]